MKIFGTHNYFVYMLTNKNKTVLYIGVTNELEIDFMNTNTQQMTHVALLKNIIATTFFSMNNSKM